MAVQITRNVISGGGSTGTVLANAVTSPAVANKYVSLSASERETGLTTGSYYYKLQSTVTPIAGTQNYSVIVEKY